MTFKERFEYDPNKDILGKGGFSRVFRAYDKKYDIYVALKIYYSNTQLDDKYKFSSEIKKAIQLNHPNLIRYIDSDTFTGTNSIGEIEKFEYCTMELADAGDFRNFLNQNPALDLIEKILIDILHGLSYLHKQRVPIIHRDLKPSNILLKNEYNGLTAKITDFNISKEIGTEHSVSQFLVGTVEYMAPEQFDIKKFGINGQLGTNVDLWSLGVMLYEHFTGEYPFGNRKKGDLFEEIRDNILNKDISEHFAKIPQPFNQVVKSCLIKKSSQRAQSPDELLDLLKKQENLDETTSIYKKNENAANEEVNSGFIINEETKQKPSHDISQQSHESGFIIQDSVLENTNISDENPYSDMFLTSTEKKNNSELKDIKSESEKTAISIQNKQVKETKQESLKTKNSVWFTIIILVSIILVFIFIYYYLSNKQKVSKTKNTNKENVIHKNTNKTEPVDKKKTPEKDSSNTKFTENKGTFTDSRDSQKYYWIKIGSQIWMAQNLNYATDSGSWCVKEITDFCNRFGRLYTWQVANTVAPKGWHLPSKKEWETLIDYLGGKNQAYEKFLKLCSLTIKGMFAGWRNSDGIYYGYDWGAYFWTSDSKSSNQSYFVFVYTGEGIKIRDAENSSGLSVRCIKD